MKLKLSTVTIKLKLPIAALLLGAGLTACTPQPDSNIVEDNMEFAQQQLRCAFDEIDYAVANESPESRAQREKNYYIAVFHVNGRDTVIGCCNQARIVETDFFCTRFHGFIPIDISVSHSQMPLSGVWNACFMGK